MCQQFITTQTQEKKKKDKGAKRTNPGTDEAKAKKRMIAMMDPTQDPTQDMSG
jgi:hypothetical protein